MGPEYGNSDRKQMAIDALLEKDSFEEKWKSAFSNENEMWEFYERFSSNGDSQLTLRIQLSDFKGNDLHKTTVIMKGNPNDPNVVRSALLDYAISLGSATEATITPCDG